MKMVLSGMLVMMASYTAIGQHTPKRATRNESFEKFDIEDFEVKRAQSVEGGKNLNHFQLADSTEIFRAGYTGYYTDEQIPPKPSFFKHYKEFYLSGFIKVRGFSFGNLTIGANGVKVGKWIYFDERGNVMKTVDEDAKFGRFDCKELLAFLDKESLIDVKTGKNRDKIKAFFEVLENGRKIWIVEVITDFLADAYKKGWKYKLDGDSGKVLEKSTLNISYTN